MDDIVRSDEITDVIIVNRLETIDQSQHRFGTGIS